MRKKSKPQLIPEDREDDILCALENAADHVSICQLTCARCTQVEQSMPDDHAGTLARLAHDVGWRATENQTVFCPTCAEKISPSSRARNS